MYQSRSLPKEAATNDYGGANWVFRLVYLPPGIYTRNNLNRMVLFFKKNARARFAQQDIREVA